MAIERVGYRIAEFAEAAGVSRSKAYEAVATGEVPTVEIAGVKRVPVEWVRQKFGVKPVDERMSA